MPAPRALLSDTAQPRLIAPFNFDCVMKFDYCSVPGLRDSDCGWASPCMKNVLNCGKHAGRMLRLTVLALYNPPNTLANMFYRTSR